MRGQPPGVPCFFLGSRVPGTGRRTAREGKMLMTKRCAKSWGQSSPIQQMLLMECFLPSSRYTLLVLLKVWIDQPS